MANTPKPQTGCRANSWRYKLLENNMHEDYFIWPNIPTFTPGFWFMLKLRMFGKKIVERNGKVEAVWYAYKGKLHMTKYSAF